MQSDNNSSCLVSNINYSTPIGQIATFLTQVGPADVKISFDNKGKFKGTAKVTYKDPKDAEQAINKLNGNRLYGFTVHVSYYKNNQSGSSTENNNKREYQSDMRRNQSETCSARSDERMRPNFHQTNHANCNNNDFCDPELINRHIFYETSNIIKKGVYSDGNENYSIKKDVENSIKNTKTYYENHPLANDFDSFQKNHDFNNNKNLIYQKIEITEEGSFEAARRIKYEEGIVNVCVLNFASATKPGGGVINGRTAQEETLSRQSSLYFSLITQNNVYEYNINNPNSFYTHDIIYSPNVVVIRDENYKLIPPYTVSVISSAAVNNAELKKKKFQKSDSICHVMKNRIKKILQVSIINNNKGIILGAFGCGVYANDPKDISKIFKELLYDEGYGYYFDRIVFAIKGKPNKFNANYEAFKNTFGFIY